MKCPYRDFQECLLEKCPSCVYKENKRTVIEGRYPIEIGAYQAIELGYAHEVIKTEYEFVSCKLIDNCVQPVPSNKQIINNNTTKKNVVVKQSLF